MSVVVDLSTGEKVHFVDRWTRKQAKVFWATLKKGVMHKHNLSTGELEEIEEIPAINYDLAYEAVLPMTISQIDSGGTSVSYSQAWIEGLSPEDYAKLEKAVYDLKNPDKEEREKNTPGN